MIFEISLIHSHYHAINHPCSYIEKNKEYIQYIDSSELSEEENIQEFCMKNQNYNTNIIRLKEYLIAYSFASFIVISMLSLIYSWFNEYRRIMYLIDGPLNKFEIKDIKNGKNNDEEEEEKNKKQKTKNSSNKNKNININKNIKKKDSKNDRVVYMNKNRTIKNIEGSSDAILTDGAYKINIKKRL